MMKNKLKFNSVNLAKKYFSSDEKPLAFLDKKFEDMKKSYKPLPKRESLLLYRDAIKLCKKFFWMRDDGKEWSDVLLKSARKEFEENRDMQDTAEVGRKLVAGRQALIEIDDKVLKVKHDMNKFIEETKIRK